MMEILVGLFIIIVWLSVGHLTYYWSFYLEVVKYAKEKPDEYTINKYKNDSYFPIMMLGPVATVICIGIYFNLHFKYADTYKNSKKALKGEDWLISKKFDNESGES